MLPLPGDAVTCRTDAGAEQIGWVGQRQQDAQRTFCAQDSITVLPSRTRPESFPAFSCEDAAENKDPRARSLGENPSAAA